MKEIDYENIKKPDIAEKKNTVDIDAVEFSEDAAYLEISEELDKKVISYIEREVRNSYEYREYINYLKTELDLTRCALMKGIDIKTNPVSLEFHHYPMNLYEIVETVGNQMLSNLGENEKLSCFDISERVVAEHYKNNIGLVPLTLTMHEMAHNRSIIVPISAVHGNYRDFMARYNDFISQDIKDRVKELEINSDSEESKAYNAGKLEKNILNYNINYYKNDKGDTNETL